MPPVVAGARGLPAGGPLLCGLTLLGTHIVPQKRRKAEEAISRGEVVSLSDKGQAPPAVPVTKQGDMKHYSAVRTRSGHSAPVADALL